METPLTREQMIAAGVTSPSSHRATCPCGTELSQGGIPWGTCRDCVEEVCGKCAASVSDDERPVFVCRSCAGKCLDCGSDVVLDTGGATLARDGFRVLCDRVRLSDPIFHGAPRIRTYDPCGFAIHLTRAELISAVYAKAGR